MKEQIYQAAFDIDNQMLRPVAPRRVDASLHGQHLNRGLFSSLTPEWPTPADVFAALDDVYHFTLDACATPENAKRPNFFTPEQDALRQEWTGIVWANPPYGRELEKWLRKAWWHDLCMKGNIFFICGRLRFGDAQNSAPFPSAVVVFELPQHERAR